MKIFKGIVIGILILALSAGLAYLFINDYRQEKRQSEYLDKLHKEASPYEMEISSIRKDIENAHDNIHKDETISQISLVFEVAQVTDVDWIEEQVSQYNYPATAVLKVDNTLGSRIIRRISNSEASIDVMFSGLDELKQSQENLQTMRDAAKQYGIEAVPMWFFDSADNTDSNVTFIKDNGFSSYTQPTDYGLNIIAGEKNDVFFTEHIPVRTGDNKVDSSIRISTEQKKPIILSFDVAELSTDSLCKDYLTAAFATLKQYMDDGKTDVVSTGEMIKTQSVLFTSEDEKLEAFEEYQDEQNARIAELQNIIDEIYSEWKIK